MSSNLYDLACTVQWCITAEALEAMLSIAARDPLPEAEIARRIYGDEALARRPARRRDDSRRMRMDGPVAVIPIDGPIYRYADLFTAVSGGVTTESLSQDFEKAMDDPAVAGVLLAIDSPGGEVTGINELADAIHGARGRKPIVAYIEGIGASAALWIASAADRVIVDETAKVGSIGVIMGVSDPAKRITRTVEFVSSQSPQKRADPTTDTGRAYYQQLTDATAEVFVAKVMRNRDLDRDAVLALAGGLVVGQQAVEAGLADAIGSEEGAIRALAMGALPGDERGPSPLRSFYPTFSKLLDAGLVSSSKEQPMPTWTDFWKGAKEAGIVPEASVEPQPPAPQPTARTAEDPEKAELRRQIAQLQAQQIQKDAVAFAEKQQATGHAYPAEAQALVALYARAAELDAGQPRADGQPSTVALLEAAYAARPANDLSRQLITPDIQGIVLAAPANPEQEELARVKADAEAYAKRANGRSK